MATIYDIITAKEIAAYWQEKEKSLAPYFGESKFPNKKVNGLTLSWIKGANNAPVGLSLSAFDADVLPLKQAEIEKLSTEMPYFKNEYRIDEKTRQEIILLLQSGSESVYTVIDKVFDDASNLMKNAALTREMMRMQMLTTGVVAISANGQSLSYDYKVPTSHKVTPSVKWDVVATADPIADIDAWIQVIENDTGAKPTEVLINSVTLAKMAKCESVKNAVFANVKTVATPTRKQVATLIEEQIGVTVYAYDKGYTVDGTFKKFVPDGTVVLMPEGELGVTGMGTTPEEADLMIGTDAEVRIVDTGVSITTWKEKDPVSVHTKGGMVALPSFPSANEVIIASVFTAE